MKLVERHIITKTHQFYFAPPTFKSLAPIFFFISLKPLIYLRLEFIQQAPMYN